MLTRIFSIKHIQTAIFKQIQKCMYFCTRIQFYFWNTVLILTVAQAENVIVDWIDWIGSLVGPVTCISLLAWSYKKTWLSSIPDNCCIACRQLTARMRHTGLSTNSTENPSVAILDARGSCSTAERESKSLQDGGEGRVVDYTQQWIQPTKCFDA